MGSTWTISRHGRSSSKVGEPYLIYPPSATLLSVHFVSSLVLPDRTLDAKSRYIRSNRRLFWRVRHRKLECMQKLVIARAIELDYLLHKSYLALSLRRLAMSSAKPAFDDLLTVSPAIFRGRRGSVHASFAEPTVSDVISSELVPAATDNTSSPVNLDIDHKDQKSVTNVPILPVLPRLHIDKQSASISGYTPSTLDQGYSTSTTPGIATIDTAFEDAYGERSVGEEGTRSPLRLKRRLAISFFGFFCTGWSDGSRCSFTYATWH